MSAIWYQLDVHDATCGIERMGSVVWVGVVDVGAAAGVQEQEQGQQGARRGSLARPRLKLLGNKRK